jgi:excisionase family DNA binding protein
VTAGADNPRETYRRADARLRLLLLGNGVDVPGRVKGDEFRQQVTTELRRMRTAMDAAVLESEERREEKVEARVIGLDEELQRIASFGSHTQHLESDALPALLTPAEAAEALRMSVSWIYRAVRDGEIRGVKLTHKKRGALRIPTSELLRLLEGSPLLRR